MANLVMVALVILIKMTFVCLRDSTLCRKRYIYSKMYKKYERWDLYQIKAEVSILSADAEFVPVLPKLICTAGVIFFICSLSLLLSDAYSLSQIIKMYNEGNIIVVLNAIDLTHKVFAIELIGIFILWFAHNYGECQLARKVLDDVRVARLTEVG